MKDAIIHAEDVRFSYVTAEGVAPIVLDGVSLSIEEGSFVAVLGHNGSGKSHPGQALQLYPPCPPGQGLCGRDGHRRRGALLSIRRTVGMVFQEPG